MKKLQMFLAGLALPLLLLGVVYIAPAMETLEGKDALSFHWANWAVPGLVLVAARVAWWVVQEARRASERPMAVRVTRKVAR